MNDAPGMPDFASVFTVHERVMSHLKWILHFSSVILIAVFPSNSKAENSVYFFEIPGERVSVESFTLILQDMETAILFSQGETRYRKEGQIFLLGRPASLWGVCSDGNFSLSVFLPSTPVFDFESIIELIEKTKPRNLGESFQRHIRFGFELRLILDDSEAIVSPVFPERDNLSDGGYTAPLFQASGYDGISELKLFEKLHFEINPNVGDGIVLIDFEFSGFEESLDIIIEHCVG